ncbi:MAG: hypothetical protein HDR35_01115 [Treponema sp.]|nr:hypothetical protein [Treponema sp.]
MDYNKRLRNLYSRREDLASIQNVNFSKSFGVEAYYSIKNATAWKYAKDGMSEVPNDYSEKSFEEGNRIIDQLKGRLSQVEFRFQGSVTTRTNIKSYSDIDLLVITTKFFSLEKGIPNLNPYKGNSMQDLQKLREKCISILKEIYYTAGVEPHAKSIKISGGSLKRMIDVVPANWYDTKEYRRENNEIYRGVEVFNAEEKKRFANFPFLLKEQIEKKDKDTNGYYRKCVRLAKNLKCDSETKILENFSSYDIQSLFFYMDFDYLRQQKDDFYVIPKVVEYLQDLISHSQKFLSLEVIDGTRKISDRVSQKELRALFDEFSELKGYVVG